MRNPLLRRWRWTLEDSRDSAGKRESGKHCEYQLLISRHVLPGSQHVASVKPLPPHCSYSRAQPWRLAMLPPAFSTTASSGAGVTSAAAPWSAGFAPESRTHWEYHVKKVTHADPTWQHSGPFQPCSP